MHANADGWRTERRFLMLWAVWCLRDDMSEIKRMCGLTPAGSPFTTMRRIYDLGAVSQEDVTGYAAEVPPPPDIELETDAFMTALEPIQPDTHEALVARHRRIVHGKVDLEASESRLCGLLFPTLSRRHACKRLTSRCEDGYGALRRWLLFKHSQGGVPVAAVS